MSKYRTQEEIFKEFDEKFYYKDHYGDIKLEEIKSFISSLRLTDKEALLAEIDEWAENNRKEMKRGKFCNDCGEQIGYDPSTKIYFCPSCPMLNSDKTNQKSKKISHYNKALTDLQAFIKSKK